MYFMNLIRIYTGFDYPIGGACGITEVYENLKRSVAAHFTQQSYSISVATTSR